MNKVAVINLKTDPKLKKDAQELADKLGVSLSQVLNGALKNFTKTREFRVVEDYTPSRWLEDILRRSKKNRKDDISFDNVDDALDYLKKL